MGENGTFALAEGCGCGAASGRGRGCGCDGNCGCGDATAGSSVEEQIAELEQAKRSIEHRLVELHQP